MKGLILFNQHSFDAMVQLKVPLVPFGIAVSHMLVQHYLFLYHATAGFTEHC